MATMTKLLLYVFSISNSAEHRWALYQDTSYFLPGQRGDRVHFRIN